MFSGYIVFLSFKSLLIRDDVLLPNILFGACSLLRAAIGYLKSLYETQC
jgi:hypothetical protein